MRFQVPQGRNNPPIRQELWSMISDELLDGRPRLVERRAAVEANLVDAELGHRQQDVLRRGPSSSGLAGARVERERDDDREALCLPATEHRGRRLLVRFEPDERGDRSGTAPPPASPSQRSCSYLPRASIQKAESLDIASAIVRVASPRSLAPAA